MTCCDDGYIVKSDGDVLLMWLLVADVFLEVLIHRRTTRFLTVVRIYDRCNVCVSSKDLFLMFCHFMVVIVLIFLNEYILVNSLLFTVKIKICVVIIFVYLFNLI